MPDRAAVVAIACLALLAVAFFVPVVRGRRRARRTLASLDALVVHAPIGIAFLDRDLRFLRANEAVSRISGRRMEDVLGCTLDEVIDRPDLTAIARDVIRTGVPVSDVDVSGVGVDGRHFNAMAGYYPITGPDGAVAGVGVVVREVTAAVDAARQRDELLSRVTRLQRITGALAAATTTADVVHVVLNEVRRALGADAISLCVVEDQELRILAADGYRAETLERWERFSIDAEIPLAEAVRTGQPIVAPNRAAIISSWPVVAGELPPERQAAVALPMVLNGVARGVIGLSYDRELHLTSEDEAFQLAVATQCASTFRRIRLHESETEALEAAEAAAARLSFLAEASDALASSLDWATTLHQVAELAVPRLADLAAVFVVEGTDVVALEIIDVDAERAGRLKRMVERWPARLDQTRGLGAFAQRREPLLVTDLRSEWLLAPGRSLELGDALIEVGFGSLLAVPMRAADRLVGVIVLADVAPRRLTADDLLLATELATRAGQAMLNAELFRDRSRVAATLQASLLPPATPTVPGLEVATRFFAVGPGIEVGGDFYDVFRLGTAADPLDRWAVVIGDVRGKGSEAATVSGAARHAIRSAGLHEDSPAAMLRHLNELLLAMASDEDLEPHFCTAVVAVVEPLERGARVVLAAAGHPPPIVLRADGSTEEASCRGTLLGVLADAEVSDAHLELGANEALVLYTDGVTERHAGTRFFDEEALASVLSRCTGFTAPVLAERIETASRAFVEDDPRDDLAIVVVRAPERPATSTATTTELPLDSSAPTLGRRFVTAALDALGLAGHHETVQLLTSELVTNAVVHGQGPVRCSVEVLDRRLRVSVSDGAVEPPRMLAPDHDRPRGRGLQLVDALADTWGVEQRPTGKTVWFELAVA